MENTTEKQYKTKDYVRRAKLKYAKERKQRDPDFAKKLIENQSNYVSRKRENDPDFNQKYLESARERSKAYRERKKQEQQENNEKIVSRDQVARVFQRVLNNGVLDVEGNHVIDDVYTWLTSMVNNETKYEHITNQRIVRKPDIIIISSLYHVSNTVREQYNISAFCKLYEISRPTLTSYLQNMHEVDSN